MKNPATRRAAGWLACVLALGALAGCDGDVALNNPRTDAVEVCHNPTRGLNPYGQTDACIADHITQGWVPVSDQPSLAVNNAVSQRGGGAGVSP